MIAFGHKLYLTPGFVLDQLDINYNIKNCLTRSTGR
jgi:hypothetical protein